MKTAAQLKKTTLRTLKFYNTPQCLIQNGSCPKLCVKLRKGHSKISIEHWIIVCNFSENVIIKSHGKQHMYIRTDTCHQFG
jgi:hypothetical protein